LIDNPHAEEKVVYANCGGDGSLMRTLKDFSGQGLNVNEIIYVTLPFGTANDLPRAFGWGAEPPWWMLNDMNYVIEEIAESEETHFNVWEIHIITRKDGGRIRVPMGRNLETVPDWSAKILMCHSFSMGIDARIGLGFEWRRTGSRFGNQFCYFWEGLKRLCCCCCDRTMKIKEIVSRFSILKNWIHSPDENFDEIKEEEEEMKREDSINSEEEEWVLFATSKEEAKGAEPILRGDPQSLVCTNIEQIMGGRVKIWKGG
jgi:diacylglycerol kinase (ATP)